MLPDLKSFVNISNLLYEFVYEPLLKTQIIQNSVYARFKQGSIDASKAKTLVFITSTVDSR